MQFTKSFNSFNDTEKLLYLIWQELQKLNGANMIATAIKQETEPVRPMRKATEEKVTGKPEKTFTCKQCGEKITGFKKFMDHKKEHKREGT